LAALDVMVVGPQSGEWLAVPRALSTVSVAVWPFLPWTIAISFTVAVVEVLGIRAKLCQSSSSRARVLSR